MVKTKSMGKWYIITVAIAAGFIGTCCTKLNDYVTHPQKQEQTTHTMNTLDDVLADVNDIFRRTAPEPNCVPDYRGSMRLYRTAEEIVADREHTYDESKRKKAIESIVEALKADPYNTKVYDNLAWCMLETPGIKKIHPLLRDTYFRYTLANIYQNGANRLKDKSPEISKRLEEQAISHRIIAQVYEEKYRQIVKDADTTPK